METLYGIIRKLKEDGITILYISHRLEEIFALCDNVTVLRDGKKITTVQANSVTREELIHMMVGRELGIEYPKEKVEIQDKVLSVRNLNRPGVLHDINFDLHKGEILGFAGLVGAGRTEVARAIMGADKGATGEITLKGKPYTITNVPHAIHQGIGLVSEDRKKEGLVLNLSIKQNLSLVNMKRVLTHGMFSEKLEQQLAEKYIHDLDIVTPSAEQETMYLSGGNQQKVVIGKWLNADCDVLIVDEPTRGIDVGAKKEIYSIMCELVKKGKAILMISSEMPELLGMCDRIIVMHDGRITGDFDIAEVTQDKLMERAIQ
jgi:ABC-type sugar transport system ATPase subunit